jgi:hypothetical protein
MFFSINTGFIFILWHENHHISLVATATREFFFPYHSMKINPEKIRFFFLMLAILDKNKKKLTLDIPNLFQHLR